MLDPLSHFYKKFISKLINIITYYKWLLSLLQKIFIQCKNIIIFKLLNTFKIIYLNSIYFYLHFLCQKKNYFKINI